METTKSRFKKILKKYKIKYEEGISEKYGNYISVKDNDQDLTLASIFNEDGNLINVIQNGWVEIKANKIDFIGIKNNSYEIKYLLEEKRIGQINLNLKTHLIEIV